MNYLCVVGNIIVCVVSNFRKVSLGFANLMKKKILGCVIGNKRLINETKG
jgi:hypothetical protein